MYEARDWYVKRRVETTLKSLRKNEFNAIYVPTKEDALERILQMIPAEALVGLGGSVTVREIGLVDALIKRGNRVLDHWQPDLSAEQILEIRRKQITSDVFISSSNAVTMDGKLVNIDGAGNRVASMIFGPKRVIVVAGVNKIVKDVDEALWRVRNVASPMNARRLGRRSPCGETGICYEDRCEPPSRLCGIVTIIERRPSETDSIVVLVGETLGY